MSVDIVGTFRKPVRLDVFVATAHAILVELLGTPDVPDIELHADRQYRQGKVIEWGRRLTRTELAARMIGEPMPGPLWQRHSDLVLNAHFSGFPDGALLFMMDYRGLYDDEPGEVDAVERASDSVQAVISPHRTCLGVLMATTLGLAAATTGEGDFVSIEIRMLEPPELNPARMIELTRLTGGDGDFAARCERFLRQFSILRGWPADVSLRD